ncbi:MAG: hypothetical protein LBS11_06210 [Oscillospiraceae bacterium]|jgi:hypothetical protein|nr:hypothetical protein [Oscillospiraceae bacterium]
MAARAGAIIDSGGGFGYDYIIEGVAGMIGGSPDLKRTFKAGFFASLFNDRERGLELVNAIMDTNYPPDTEVTIETLSDVFFMGIQNDLALLVGDTVLFLGEHQSTINNSITIRFASYYGRVLESVVERKRTYKKGILRLARPVFVVFYNGADPYNARSVLKLSSSFDEPGSQLEKDSFIELQAVVYNIHSPENAGLVRKSEYLLGYVEVIRRGREYQAQGLSAMEAVSRAIQDCIREGIIADYLEKHAAEVVGMLTEQFSVEEYLSAREEELKEEGREEGIHIGVAKRNRELALQLRGLLSDMNAVISLTGLGEDEILRLWYPKTN